MKRTLRRSLAAIGGLLLLVPCASAHPGHDGDHGLTWDFSGGFLHPLTGWDHLLAMVAVGLWAAQLGGRARWLLPLSFVGMMSVGAVMGRLGVHLPVDEFGIAASVFVLGLCVAAALRLPVAAGSTLVGVFALFHGVAHGAEMPASASSLGYGAGFILTTILLHAAGLGLGLWSAARAPRLARYAGWAMAASGLVLVAVR